MIFRKKISVVMLAMLITYIGISFPLSGTSEFQNAPQEDSRIIRFEQAPPVPVIFIQEKTSPVISAGWKTQIRLPGLDLLSDLYQTRQPDLRLVRKIFVVNLTAYTPCKSILLSPFHDFI
jgi:hypothetical protein